MPTVGKVLKGKDGHMLRETLIVVSPESSNSAPKNIGQHS